MSVKQLAAIVTCFLIAVTTAFSQNQKNENLNRERPVIPGDFADPSVIRKGNTYYAAGTSSEWAPHFPMFQSSDLIHWMQSGYVFKQTPSWTSGSFWAPEFFYWKGTYYLYYVARKKSDGISCIGVATSPDPAQGFTDQGILFEFGKEAIDPFIIEEDGKLFITWKAYGLDQRPIEILGSRLSDDGLKLEGEPFSLLRDDERRGLEGQCLVKRNGYYYLFYSPGDCCGRQCSYETAVARSATLQGPYTRFEKNPLLAQTEEWKCTGHGTLVSSADGKDFYLYHAYNKSNDVYTGRQGMLAEVTWDSQTGWPSIHPLGKKAAAIKGFRDDFSGKNLADRWQWDFRNSMPVMNVEKGNLNLSGEIIASNITGTVVTVRPLAADYEIITEVINENNSLKGLVLYGDADQSAGIGITSDTVSVWEARNKKRTTVNEVKLNSGSRVELKIKVEKGYMCRFYWRAIGKEWSEIKTADEYFNADFLPPWDRSPRPGLQQSGSAPAVFNFFEIKYN